MARTEYPYYAYRVDACGELIAFGTETEPKYGENGVLYTPAPALPFLATFRADNCWGYHPSPREAWLAFADRIREHIKTETIRATSNAEKHAANLRNLEAHLREAAAQLLLLKD